MAEFNVADASVATVLKEASAMALIKGYQPNTWFYAPRAARINRDSSGRPLFALVRNRKHEAGGQGLETLGGVFGAQLELAVPLPTQEEQKVWQEHIGLVSSVFPSGASFRFQPLRLSKGTMSILGVDQYALHPEKLLNIPVGASSTIPVSIELNALGADTFYQAIGHNQALPLVVHLQYKYDLVIPTCVYKITVDGQKVYDYFSLDAKARASFFGLVGGQADLHRTRDSLRSRGAIVIEQVSAPAAVPQDRIKLLEDRLVDSYVKSVLEKITEKPQVDPAVAKEPGGFFGGVSVAMKSVTTAQSISQSATLKLSDIVEDLFNISYVFTHQFQELDPEEYVTDVIDDNELPVVINLTATPEVSSFSGQYGYKRTDGVFVSNSITGVPGASGGILTGSIQFAVNEPIPEKTDIQLSVDWTNPNWQDRTQKLSIENTESGVNYTFSPFNNVAKQRIVTDLERYPAGAIGIINWKTEIPAYADVPSKVYSGSAILFGKGAAGEPQSLEVDYPYPEGRQADAKLLWGVHVTLPGGQVLETHGEAPAVQEGIPLLGAILFPGLGSAPSPLFDVALGAIDNLQDPFIVYESALA